MTAAVTIAVAALAGAAAPAAQAPRATPVRVDAENVVYAFQKRDVTFTGKEGKPVTMTRGDARLSCRKLLAHTDEAGQIVSATCSGDVRLTSSTRVVTCDRATFDGPGERIVCEGNPVMRESGGAEATGKLLVYDLENDQVTFSEATVTLPADQIDQRQKALEQRRKERKK